MPDLVIVDTDVLIDAARNITDAVTCLEEVERQASLAISIVSEMELVWRQKMSATIVSLLGYAYFHIQNHFPRSKHILPTRKKT